MQILSPETDNCPSWISGRERMTIENISWSISAKECCQTRRGLNSQPPDHQMDAPLDRLFVGKQILSGEASFGCLSIHLNCVKCGGPDQSYMMCRLVRSFAVCIMHRWARNDTKKQWTYKHIYTHTYAYICKIHIHSRKFKKVILT